MKILLHLVRRALIGVSVALTALLASSLPAQEFLRGDTNDDGVVSIADAYYLTSWLFRSRIYPACLDTGDADDNGQINLTDALTIANVHLMQEPLTGPFPTPGEDATPDDLSCDNYGAGAPITDPNARLVVLEAIAEGDSDVVLTVTLGASSSAAIGGFAGTLSIDGGILGDGIRGTLPRCILDSCERGRIEDLSGATTGEGTPEPPFNPLGVYETGGGKAHFAFIPNLTDEATVPASDEIVPVLRLELCLADGTVAGDYTALIEDAELIDDATGSAIPVPDEAAIVSVLADLTVPGCRPPEPPPPPPPTLNTEFRLESVSTIPGGKARVPMIVKADGDIQGFAFSLDFNEEVLTLERIDRIVRRSDGSPFGFEHLSWNNENVNPGSAGVDEGFAVGSLVVSFQTNEFNLPAGDDHYVYEFVFHVDEETPVGTSTGLRFLDGGQTEGDPIVNGLVAYGVKWTPETAESFVLVDGLVKIIGEISVFRRGDTNGDLTVDVSDGVATLNFLFLGGANPACFDAADANDDGAIGLSDAVYSFNALFLEGDPFPAPSPEPGVDPTEDSLGCLLRS